MAIPMDIESRRSPPARIHINLDAGPQGFFEVLGQLRDRLMEFVHGIQNQGSPFSQLIREVRRSQLRDMGRGATVARTIADKGLRRYPFALPDQTEARNIELMVPKDLIEVRPRQKRREFPGVSGEILEAFAQMISGKLLQGNWREDLGQCMRGSIHSFIRLG